MSNASSVTDCKIQTAAASTGTVTAKMCPAESKAPRKFSFSRILLDDCAWLYNTHTSLFVNRITHFKEWGNSIYFRSTFCTQHTQKTIKMIRIPCQTRSNICPISFKTQFHCTLCPLLSCWPTFYSFSDHKSYKNEQKVCTKNRPAILINIFFCLLLMLCCVTYRCGVTRLDDAVVFRVASVGVGISFRCLSYQADLNVAVSVIAGSPRAPLWDGC